MNIPNHIDPLGNRGVVPVGYTRLEYLETTGTQYIIFPVNDSPTDEMEVRTVGAFTDTSQGVEGKTGESTSSFFWGIDRNLYLYAGCGKFATSSMKPDTEEHTFILRKSTAQSAFIVDDTVLLDFAFPAVSMLNTKGYGLWCLSNSLMYPAQKARKSSVKFIQNGKLIYDFVPALDSIGRPCMFDTVTRKPFVNSGTGAFIAGLETQTQLNNLLRKLPDRTGQDVGTLQVRLADELQTPENEAKLDAMLAKNWEISQAA